MATLAERLLARGIRPRSYREGNHKITCPRCLHTRNKRNEPCLSLTIEPDGAVWHCHHCEWSQPLLELPQRLAPQHRDPEHYHLLKSDILTGLREIADWR